MVEDILTKVDRATMRIGLEGREPLIDHRLAEWVAQLPNEFKISSKGQKILLKEIAHSYIPKEIMDRPKMGFGIPLVEWFQTEIQDYIHQLLNPEHIKNQGIFNDKAVNQVISDYHKNNSQNVFKLWNLIMFQLWYDKWMK
jgi:asparagine synthase (glutamine-hydrolysing)